MFLFTFPGSCKYAGVIEDGCRMENDFPLRFSSQLSTYRMKEII